MADTCQRRPLVRCHQPALTPLGPLRVERRSLALAGLHLDDRQVPLRVAARASICPMKRGLEFVKMDAEEIREARLS